MRITQRVKKILANYESDCPGTKANIARILMHGRLGGTGKVLILPVDQGFEHGPARSFAKNPPAYDPHYHFQLAVDAGLSAYAAPLGMIEAGADSFAGAIPTILKCNSGNSVSTNKDQAVTASVEDALLAYDRVRASGAGEIDVVGLCSGAFLGIQVAARRAVRRAVLFNGLAFVWNEEAATSGMTAHIRGSLLDARRWKRLLTGQIDALALARAVVAKGRIRGRERWSRLQGNPPADDVALLIQAVVDRGTDLHLVSSQGDPSIAYLAKHRGGVSGLRHTVLSGVDHTIRPAWAHAHVIELIRGAGDERR